MKSLVKFFANSNFAVKMRNTLNVALGTQKGRSNPSAQAIEKWEADIHFLDGQLKADLVAEIA